MTSESSDKKTHKIACTLAFSGYCLGADNSWLFMANMHSYGEKHFSLPTILIPKITNKAPLSCHTVLK